MLAATNINILIMLYLCFAFSAFGFTFSLLSCFCEQKSVGSSVYNFIYIIIEKEAPKE